MKCDPSALWDSQSCPAKPQQAFSEVSFVRNVIHVSPVRAESTFWIYSGTVFLQRQPVLFTAASTSNQLLWRTSWGFKTPTDTEPVEVSPVLDASGYKKP